MHYDYYHHYYDNFISDDHTAKDHWHPGSGTCTMTIAASTSDTQPSTVMTIIPVL